MLDPTEAVASTPFTPPGPETIILITHDDGVRAFLNDQLSTHGIRTFSLQTGADLVPATHLRLARLRLVVIQNDSNVMAVQSLCTVLRLHAVRAPILVLTAAFSEGLAGKIIESGADRVLEPHPLERVGSHALALFLRARGTFAARIRTGPFFVDLPQSAAFANSERIDLTPGQLRILWFLCRYPNTIVTLNELATELMASVANPTARKALIQQVHRLKERLGPWARHIETRRGFGYVLKIADTP